MKIEMKDYKRNHLFERYHKSENAFIILTTKIDVTPVVEYCNKNKRFYATMGHLISKTVNEIEAFKYRYQDGELYYFDKVNPSFTQMYDDDTIGFFSVPYQDDIKKFTSNFVKIQKDHVDNKIFSEEKRLDEIWFSCVPWFKFTSLTPPYDKNVTIPQFVWDKYELEQDKYYVNLMITVHHGFADGSHIGKFINTLQKYIDEFK